VKPVSSGGLGSLLRSGLWVVLVLLLIFGLIRCSRDDCDELRATFGEASNEYQQCLRSNQGGGGYGYRSSGGSFGGFSSGGGGHK
jgi:hypothetical protein